MDIIRFLECNVVYAKGQPEYKLLPALRENDGNVIICWRPSFIERLKILFTGKIWLSILTFNKPLQPLLLSVDKPIQTTQN